eukprot:5877297-Pleurochrysis_carterae.AAC.1
MRTRGQESESKSDNDSMARTEAWERVGQGASQWREGAGGGQREARSALWTACARARPRCPESSR